MWVLAFETYFASNLLTQTLVSGVVIFLTNQQPAKLVTGPRKFLKVIFTTDTRNWCKCNWNVFPRGIHDTIEFSLNDVLLDEFFDMCTCMVVLGLQVQLSLSLFLVIFSLPFSNNVRYHWRISWSWRPHLLACFFRVTADCEARAVYHESEVAISFHAARTYTLRHIVHLPERRIFPGMLPAT